MTCDCWAVVILKIICRSTIRGHSPGYRGNRAADMEAADLDVAGGEWMPTHTGLFIL